MVAIILEYGSRRNPPAESSLKGFRLKGLYWGEYETAQVNWITGFREFESDQSEPQLTQLFYTAGNLVAGLQP
jgi:hypothetical protein